jgi:hypothetical protein
LLVSAYKSGDNRAQAYLKQFKSQNSFSIRSEVRDDFYLLRQILEASGQASTSDDYKFDQSLLEAIISSTEGRSDTYGLWKQSVQDLNILLRGQGKSSEADRMLSEALSHSNSDDTTLFKSLLSPEAGGPVLTGGQFGSGSGPMSGGPMSGGPMSGGPMGGGPMSGGPMGGGPLGGPGAGMGGPRGGPMGGPPGGPGMGGPMGRPGMGGAMGGRGGPPGQDGGG